MAVAPNGTISWRPPLNAVGIHDVIVRVNDGRGGTDLQAFKIEVTPGNNAPVFTSQLPQNINPAVNQPFQYQAKAVDLDGDTITYSIIPNSSKPVTPTNATINPTTGVINWTPTTAQQGGAFNWAYAGEVEPWEILIKATDNKGGEAFQRIELTVSPAAPNRPPSITSTPRTNTRLGKTYFYQVEATDPDGNPLTYTLLNPPSGMAFATPASTPAGMTFQEGLISWTPEVSQQGTYPITVRVSDGLGGIATQTFNLTADNVASNRAPSIDSTPEQITNLAKLYQYNLTGSDADGDRLLWSLDKAPSGMIVDPQSGSLRWQPNAEQIGEHTVSVRTIDGNGGYAVQEFTLAVRGINTPPAVVSTPPSKAAVNQVYAYTVVATDLENDPLTFSLSKYPVGMAIDSNGVIQWTPNATQIGQHSVEVAVTDKQGAIATQTFTVNAATTAINLSPAITSTPVFTASPGRPYTYQVTAADADGTISQYQLLQSPPGMTINSATGAITWNNPTAGNHQVVVGAVDNSGTGAAQGFELSARANSTPVVPQIPPQSASPGQSYRYDLKATDADGDLLTFALIQSPSGMTVDEFGRISWKPSATNIGNHPVEVKVTDTFGESVTVSYNLSVVADTVAPKVSLIASNNTVDVGDYVTFTVNAVDNVKVESLGLTINGTPVVLDAQGQANVKLNNLGTITAVATAKDAAGNVGNATASVAAIDTSDVNAPTINISLEDDAEITAPVNITGTISDSNLAYYTLEVAPVGGGQFPGDGGGFKEVYRGTAAVSNGTIATFDPTVLANGAYVLKFTAFDTNGNGSTTERTVNVAGDLKLGNFRLSFTDLSVPVAGIPINVTRTYDSLNANKGDDFGYGWRMEFRDTDLKTSLKADPIYEELGINTVPFDSKTKVFITLPGGKRETFTFKPTPHHLNQYLGAAGPGAQMYKPAFESQKGSTMTLTVKDANLIRNENGYYGVNGQPFNPENPAFGGVYVLTTKEGLVYEIDAASGDLLTATDANGNKLTFSDAGIASSSGKSVTFERDVAGRIVGVVDPDGKKVKYEYDAKGDLVAATDQEQNKTEFVYNTDQSHYLEKVIDPLGNTGVRTEYDDKGRLKKIIDADGDPVELIYDPDNSIQTVKDAFGNPTTYVYDLRGNVVKQVNALGQETNFKYDDNNNLIETKDAAGLVAKYTYDASGNLLSRTEPYCGCPGTVPGITNYTYNKYGQPTSIVMPTGASIKMEYDRAGNMLKMQDGLGNVIQSYVYDSQSRVVQETDTFGTTYYGNFDAFGNPRWIKDAEGNETTMTYNAKGLLETMTENGVTSTFQYDGLGRQTRADYGGGLWVEYDYEGAGADWTSIEAPTIGRIERKFTDDGKLGGWVTNGGGEIKFTYNEAGQLETETDPSGSVTRYGYDQIGRVKSVKDESTGVETIYHYDTLVGVDPDPGVADNLIGKLAGKTVVLDANTRYTTSYTYDSNGRMKTTTDPRGHIWKYRYNSNGTTVIDPLGRETTSIQSPNYLPVETIYPDGTKSKVEYLFSNNLQEAKDYPTRIIDRGGNDRKFTYDDLGRLKTVTDLGDAVYTYHYGESGLERVTGPNQATLLSYQYEDGNLKKIIYPDGGEKEFIYNSLTNRLEQMKLPSGVTVSYEYDAAGQEKRRVSTLDGEVVSNWDAETGQLLSVTDAAGTTAYHYDPDTGAFAGLDYPNGGSIRYERDGLGRVEKVAVKADKTAPDSTAYITEYRYDANGNADKVKATSPGGQVLETAMVYDAVNRLKERTLPNGVKTVYQYQDKTDLVEKITHFAPDGVTVLASVAYERKGIGEPTKITREDGSYVRLEYDTALRVDKETYYSAAGVLLQEIDYGYDAAGNRQVVSSGLAAGTYSYENVNQLASVTNGSNVDTYTYDAGGRVDVVNRNGVIRDFDYNTDNLISQVKDAAGNVLVEYDYDSSGRRVEVKSAAGERDYLVAPSMGDGLESPQLVMDGNGNALGAYVYAGNQPLMRFDGSGNPVYYLTDAMGSVIGLAGASGQGVAKFNYDSFGNLKSSSGTAASLPGNAGGDFRFQGQWLDDATGLYNFRARYYDPETGRFMSYDPIDLIEMEPESSNPYQFVYNNPHVYSDPTGMFSIAELNSTINTQSALAAINTYARAEAKDYVLDKLGETTGNIVMSAFGNFMPGTNLAKDLLKARDGNIFEDFLDDTICQYFDFEGLPLIKSLRFFPQVQTNGDARSGFDCYNYNDPQTRRIVEENRGGGSRPDFVFIEGNYAPKNPKSYLIGDIKLTQAAVRKDIKENDNQWQAMSNYAAKNQLLPFVSYISLLEAMPGESGERGRGISKTDKQMMAKEALKQGVILVLANFID
ncbi:MULTISPECIES: putative Ig domain-containing protein [unclassified Microcoleus]